MTRCLEQSKPSINVTGDVDGAFVSFAHGTQKICQWSQGSPSFPPLIPHVALLILICDCASVCAYLFVSISITFMKSSAISPMGFCNIFPFSCLDIQDRFHLFRSECIPRISSQTQHFSHFSLLTKSMKGSLLPTQSTNLFE